MKIELHTDENRLPLWDGERGRPPELEGLQAIERTYTYEGNPYKYYDYVYPELHPKTMFKTDVTAPFVAELGGRRWRILINLESDEYGHPSGGTVTFEETEDPVTPSVPLRPGTRSYAFGQPNFIQNSVLPHVDGRSAFLLACIESGWGDSGNENLFVGLDEQGIPCGLYHEYSCC